ncbi:MULTISPECIES: MltR family transcriptional regulator [Halomonadaceae]|uniref:MltR family transcriptional regulator n=1 Tax=Halomonadaceae TaxID=28256 RepID=UPI001C2768DF|nr:MULTISPECIES: MltR family transcriptional regulator [Halomonas]
MQLKAGALQHDINQFLDEANRENASGTERGLVLVWAAMLDEMLSRLLERFLVEDKVTQEVLRDGPSGPLTSFSSRTKVAFSLGLIAKDEMQAINKVRTIRNDFAHKVGISLEGQSFRSKCEDLYSKTVGDAATFEARHFYSAGCARLLLVLSNRISEIEGERCQKRTESKPLQQR